uniref:H/ACA ribonucleoprotein complex subunit n=1 Tax=Ciona savignyi TaxID=51511 RepID=H2YHP1_CIOSA
LIIIVAVVVKASVGKPALNLDSVLFLEDKSFLGRVYETFGPVPAPYYVVCFNETEKTSELSLEQKIYFAPDIKDYTSFILTAQLTQAKGSDASWKDDREPSSPQLIEFSDDEEERSFKKKLKNPGTQTGTKPVKRGRNNNQNNQSVGKQNNQNAGTWVNRGTRFANPTNQMRDADINWMMSYNQGNPQQGGRGGQYRQPPPPPPHFDQSNPYLYG